MDIGTVLVYLALALTAAAVAFGILFLYSKNQKYRRIARYLAAGSSLITTAVFLLLVYYFLTSNLDILYVHGHTKPDYDWYYKLTGLWAGEEGTILLWTWLISLSVAIEELLQIRKEKKTKKDREEADLYDWIRTICLILLAAFLILSIQINIFKATASGETVLQVEGLNGAVDVDAIAYGNFLIAEAGSNRILHVDGSGNTIGTVDLSAPPSDAESFDFTRILIAEASGNRVYEVNSTGDILWEFSGLNSPVDVEYLDTGNLLVTERNRVFEVNSTNVVTWEYIELNDARDAERLGNGNTLIAEYGANRVIEVNSAGMIVWRMEGLDRPRDVERYYNGITMVTEETRIIDVDASGEIVWVIDGLDNPNDAERQGDGNTMISRGNRVVEIEAPGLFFSYPEGAGLNSLLLTPLMIVHPPVEFGAFAFLTIPFASALAYLITGGRKWTEVSLQWSRLSWLFLSLGIGIGALWAYVSLGWGGYWGWDPVEVANLIPWIALTAFVHTQQYFRKRELYTHLAPLMAIITFVLSIFATWETRSGFIASPLHAFTGPGAGLEDPAARLVAILEGNHAAAYFMMMMLAILIVGGMLFMWRFAQIRKREGTLNNLALGLNVSFVVFLSVLLAFVMVNVASFVSLGMDLASLAGNRGIGLAILAILLMSYPLMWILLTIRETEEEAKPITVSSIINDKTAMLASVAIFSIWFIVTFLLMVMGSEGLQPEVFTSRLPFIIAALAIAMTVCLAWMYFGRANAGYLALALIIVVLVVSLAFSDPFVIYISVLIVALVASFVRIFRIGVGAKWKEKDRRPQIAGMLLLIAGTLGFVFWSNLTRIHYILPGVKPDLTVGFLGMIASSIALIGGVFALRGRNPILSILGAVCAILTLGFFFTGTMLGVVALIFLLASRSSFSKSSTDARSLRAILGGTAPHIIHLGIVLLLIGYAASTYRSIDTNEDGISVIRSPVEFAGYELEITWSEGFDSDGDGLYEAVDTYVEVTQNGVLVDNATFRLWWMIPENPNVQPHYVREVYVENTYFEDLYITPHAFWTASDNWTGNGDIDKFISDKVDIVYLDFKTLPLINALWGGMWMMTLGIGLLIFADYLTLPVKPRRPAKPKPVERVEEEKPIKTEKEEVPIVEEPEKDYEKMLEEELEKLG